MIEGIRTASPNNAVERTAGSHSLAAAAHRERSTHVGRYLRLGAFSVAIIVLVACSARLPDRSETAMACPSISTDNHYFPIGLLEPRDSRGDAFRRRWYSSHLRAMGESSISCGADSMETYRFLWLRTFHRPVSVRIAKRGDGAKLTVVELHFFFQAEDGIRDLTVTGVQTC